jgi:aspartate kinase
MPGSLIKSVSRGYSDLCAALCAVALGAEELQIWKEVDGIFTADPRKVSGARLLATITSEEAAELTYYGSEVLHPLTIEQIDGAGIPLRLKNVMDPQGMGTIIHPSSRVSLPFSAVETPPRTPKHERDVEAAGAKLSFMAANGYYGPNQYRRKPTAVTVVRIITHRKMHQR